MLIPLLLSGALLLPADAGALGSAAGENLPTCAKRNKRFTLTILHNNDGESQLIDAGEGLEEYGGVARFTTRVKRLKRRAVRGYGAPARWRHGVLMLSSGDNFLAGPEFNASLEKGVPYYDAIALDHIGYDAIAIGNHEFDFGPDVLANFIRSFSNPVPFLSANLDVSPEPSLAALERRGRIAKSTVVCEGGELVGVIGATTPALASISTPRDVVVDPRVARAINREVRRLRASGVNKLILISHLQSVEEDLELARHLRGIDVMIAGGGDELLANQGDLLIPGDEELIFGPYPLIARDAQDKTVPVVTTTGAYRYVGRLVVRFNGQGRVVLVNTQLSGPKRISSVGKDAVPPNPYVQRRVVRPVQAAIADLAQTVIGNSAVALNGLRNDVRTIETNEGNLIADALLWQAAQVAGEFGAPQPDIALQNGGGIRNDSIIGPGPVTELDTFDMLPFANFVVVVPDIPPLQLKHILENAVSRVELVDGRFAQVAGFRFTWDPDGRAQVVDDEGNVLTPGTRVRSVTLDDGTRIVANGSVVAGAPSVNIATIDFSARGGDQYPFRGAPFTTLGVSYQQALVNYIVDALNGQITAAEYPEGGEGRIERE